MFRVLVVSCSLRRVRLRRLFAALPLAFSASLLRALPLLRLFLWRLLRRFFRFTHVCLGDVQVAESRGAACGDRDVHVEFLGKVRCARRPRLHSCLPCGLLRGFGWCVRLCVLVCAACLGTAPVARRISVSVPSRRTWLSFAVVSPAPRTVPLQQRPRTSGHASSQKRFWSVAPQARARPRGTD